MADKLEVSGSIHLDLIKCDNAILISEYDLATDKMTRVSAQTVTQYNTALTEWFERKRFALVEHSRSFLIDE